MRWNIIVERFMPIRIRRRDKNSGSSQGVDRLMVMGDAPSVSRAYYAAVIAAFGVLYGSIQRMLNKME